MPEDIDCRVDHGRGRQHRNPQQRVFKVNSGSRDINQVGRQRLGKPSGPDESPARGVDCQAGDSANDQCVPGMAL